MLLYSRFFVIISYVIDFVWFCDNLYLIYNVNVLY
uniref:Uncharacterized protein n=1 Tax=Geladintestivirus 2 TaxID=3233134 RepID=A0AAU8ML14_9CAUD